MLDRTDEGDPSASQVAMTQLLRRSREGDKAALDELMPFVYQQLGTLASRCLRSERSDHTLRTTALVNEAYLKLVGADVAWEDRTHFFAVAARVMRRILVDHARTLKREKRGGGAVKLALDEAALVAPERGGMLLAIDEAMERLARFDARKSNILELVYFGGLTYAEAAAATGVSEATLHRELKLAKAWIHHEVTRANP